MKKVINWFKTSNRWKHIVGGIAIGVLSDDWYCTGLAGVGIASALEYKDRAHGGAWDWVDWILTVAGAFAGYGIKFCL